MSKAKARENPTVVDNSIPFYNWLKQYFIVDGTTDEHFQVSYSGK